MASLIIITDPEREISTFVDADTQQGYGPAVLGPDGRDALEAFADAMPFDLGVLSSGDLAALFLAYVASVAGAAAPAPAETPADPVESIHDRGVDAGAALAERAAQDATTVPAPAPADTDAGAAPQGPVRVIDCPACNGEGTLDLDDGNGPVRCNMCQGSKVITVPA